MLSFTDEVQTRENLLEDEPVENDLPTLDTDYTISAGVQLANMLAFAFIWSIGAFVPFR